MQSEQWPPPPVKDPKSFEKVNQGRWTGTEVAWFISGFGFGALIFTLLYNLPA